MKNHITKRIIITDTDRIITITPKIFIVCIDGLKKSITNSESPNFNDLIFILVSKCIIEIRC